MEGDEQGEWTFTGGRSSTVIDYVIGNEDTREKVEKVEGGERVDSGPSVVWVRGEDEGGVERKKEGRKKGGGRGNWTEEGRKGFMERFGRMEEGDRGVDEEWRELRERIKVAVEIQK